MASDEEPTVQFVDEKLISGVMKVLQDQRKVSRFCDVVFKVCGEEIFAHSNVLAAASPYFASFLGMGQDLPRAFSQKIPQIIEIHIDGSSESNSGYGMAVRKVVDFMYTSVIELSHGILTQVVEIANIMQIDTILEYCNRFRQSLHNSDRDSTLVTDNKLIDQENIQQIKKDSEHEIDNVLTNGYLVPESLSTDMDDRKDQTIQTNFLANSNAVNINSISTTSLILNSSSSVTAQSVVEASEDIVSNEALQASTNTADAAFEESAEEIQEPDTVGLIAEGTAVLVAPTTASISSSSNLVLTSQTKNKEEDREEEMEAVKFDTEAEADTESEKSSTQCSGAVRSSLRIRLGKKHSRGRSIYRKKGKLKSRSHNSANNSQTNGNEESSVTFEVYVCDDCLYSTYNYYHFKRHQKIHLEGKYSCDKCDYKASKLKTLTDHNRSHLHSELQCSYCEYKATNAEELMLHLSRHGGEHPYFCCLCDMKFKTKTQLNLHAPKHSEDKPFVCPKCFAGFKWKHALKSHMVVHSDTKDHLCDVCGFATAHKSQLKAHRLIHTGETYKCSVQGCTFQALKRQNLKYHMLTHTHEKPHICRVCSQSFSLIKNMKRHMLLHSNDRPYKCEHCPFTSTRYDKLKEHLLKQHGLGERPNKKHRISDYQHPNGDGLFQESCEEEGDENNTTTATIPATTTQIVITATDDIPVPFAITRVNSDGFTEISYPTIQYV